MHNMDDEVLDKLEVLGVRERCHEGSGASRREEGSRLNVREKLQGKFTLSVAKLRWGRGGSLGLGKGYLNCRACRGLVSMYSRSP
jgi:hypothetical protein